VPHANREMARPTTPIHSLCLRLFSQRMHATAAAATTRAIRRYRGAFGVAALVFAPPLLLPLPAPLPLPLPQ
jgi:hypothetical protein